MLATMTTAKRMAGATALRHLPDSRESRGGHMFPFPICTFHSHWHGLCGTRSLNSNRDPQATVLSIDGIGAYDHVHRSAMLGKLLEVPSFRGLLPFVRAAYLEPSRYKWADAEGGQTRHLPS